MCVCLCVCAECAHVFILACVLVLSSSGLPEQGYGLELWKINKLLRNLEFGRNLAVWTRDTCPPSQCFFLSPPHPHFALCFPLPPYLPSRERLSSAHWPGLPLRGFPSIRDRGVGACPGLCPLRSRALQHLFLSCPDQLLPFPFLKMI